MRLTERDFGILRYLAQQGVASSHQLMRGFFQSQVSARKRISTLIRAGMIESLPLSEIKAFSRLSYLQTGALLTGSGRQGIASCRVYRLSEKIRDQWPSTSKLADVKMWSHQILLNELRAVFQEKFPNAVILNDPMILEEQRRFEKWRTGSTGDLVVPDLVVRIGESQIALEVERNLKSQDKYRSRFMRFEDGPYTHVIYYCNSERIFNSLSKFGTHYQGIAFARFGTIHEVFRTLDGWMRLDDFLKRRPLRND